MVHGSVHTLLHCWISQVATIEETMNAGVLILIKICLKLKDIKFNIHSPAILAIHEI